MSKVFSIGVLHLLHLFSHRLYTNITFSTIYFIKKSNKTPIETHIHILIHLCNTFHRFEARFYSFFSFALSSPYPLLIWSLSAFWLSFYGLSSVITYRLCKFIDTVLPLVTSWSTFSGSFWVTATLRSSVSFSSGCIKPLLITVAYAETKSVITVC